MKRIVVFSGAGMSAESGLKTFRDSGGLWEEYDIHEVATPEAWERNPELVLDFYNQRREQVLQSKPNAAHHAIVALEKKFDVVVVTQNIDNLHELAGSTNVIHLHGEILKARSVKNSDKLYNVNGPLSIHDRADDGSPLRPHVVWFGEDVPMYELGKTIIQSADILIIVGTSLNVFPAAGLVLHAKEESRKILIDPNEISIGSFPNLIKVQEKAGSALPRAVNDLLSNNH
jgi:NAD-dependent deacetylase